MCENWKYERLAKYIKKQSIDEMKHAECADRAHSLPRRHSEYAADGSQYRRLPSSSSLRTISSSRSTRSRCITATFKPHRMPPTTALASLFEKLLKDEERPRGLARSATPPDHRNRHRPLFFPAGQGRLIFFTAQTQRTRRTSKNNSIGFGFSPRLLRLCGECLRGLLRRLLQPVENAWYGRPRGLFTAFDEPLRACETVPRQL